MTVENRIIAFAKNSIDQPTNTKVEMVINTISSNEAALFKDSLDIEVNGYVRKIDNFSIVHTHKNHGSAEKEEKRGQVAITIYDFALIEEIAKAGNAVYTAKNKIGRDCIMYCYEKVYTYYLVEEIRTGKKELVLNTMYKIKPPQS
jgi:hypothetical protein